MFKIKFSIKVEEQDDYDQELNEEAEEDDEMKIEDEVEVVTMTNAFETDLVPKPNKYIFSCAGLGLKNIARIEL